MIICLFKNLISFLVVLYAFSTKILVDGQRGILSDAWTDFENNLKDDPCFKIVASSYVPFDGKKWERCHFPKCFEISKKGWNEDNKDYFLWEKMRQA